MRGLLISFALLFISLNASAKALEPCFIFIVDNKGSSYSFMHNQLSTGQCDKDNIQFIYGYQPANEKDIARLTQTKFSNDLNVLIELFRFDLKLFALLSGALIFSFLTAHFAGRVVRWLGKA